MCQIAFIVLGVMGLCGGITLKSLSIGVLITVGIQIIAANNRRRSFWKSIR